MTGTEWAARRRAALAPVVVAGAALLALTGCDPAPARGHDATGRAATAPAAAPAASSSPETAPSLIPKGHPVRKVVRGNGGTARSGPGRTGSGLPPADPCAHNHHCSVPPAPDGTPIFTRPSDITRPGDLPPGAPTIIGAPVG